MRFAKGHGTQNDFVIVPDPGGDVELTPGLAARLCDRRAGLGADGVLHAVPAALAGHDGGQAEWFMDYRNADGSTAEMCGNGIRVFGRYLLDHDLVRGPEFTVATLAGTRAVRAEPGGDITVDMGRPEVTGPGRAQVAGRAVEGLAISLGNPHLACVVDEPLDDFDLTGPPGLDDSQFPHGANLELVRIVGALHAEMRVHERGSGPTRSCGTGAVAAAVAATLAQYDLAEAGPAAARGIPLPRAGWAVDVPGGRLRVLLDEGTSLLSGPAVIVAEGELDDAWLSGAVTPAQSSPVA